MKDFHEAVLTINVKADIAEAYKTAIESENHPNGLRDHWNGNYAYVVIGNQIVNYRDNTPAHKNTVNLTIQLLSHTLPNLKETVEWYEEMGCIVVRTDYKEGKSSN